MSPKSYLNLYPNHFLVTKTQMDIRNQKFSQEVLLNLLKVFLLIKVNFLVFHIYFNIFL